MPSLPVSLCIWITTGFFYSDTPRVRRLPAWFPGAGFKRTAKAWYALVTDACEAPFKYVQGAKVCGFATLRAVPWTSGFV